MNHTITRVRIPTALTRVTTATRHQPLALLALITSSAALAQSSGGGVDAGAFQTALDKPATQLCKVLEVLPESKWVGFFAFAMLLLGLALIFTRQRGGMAWVGYAVIGVALLSAIIAIAKGLGVGCS